MAKVSASRSLEAVEAVLKKEGYEEHPAYLHSLVEKMQCMWCTKQPKTYSMVCKDMFNALS